MQLPFYHKNIKVIGVALNLIKILSDGNIHSIDNLGDILNIDLLTINQSIHIIREWGLHLFKIPYNNSSALYLNEPLSLLDKQLIQTMLPKRNISVLSVINSTNQYLIDRLYKLQIGDACVAEYQFHGRGKRGTKWISPFGYNLYYSIYWCFENLHFSSLIYISLIVSIAIAEMFQILGINNIQVKWPNDLYINNRKLAGILVETTSKTSNLTHVVIGIGMNLNMPDLANQHKWINLSELGTNFSRNFLVVKITKILYNTLLLFKYEGFAPFALRWSQLDYFYNKQINLLTKNNQKITGIARGINDYGSLILAQNGKLNTYPSNDISLLRLSN